MRQVSKIRSIPSGATKMPDTRRRAASIVAAVIAIAAPLEGMRQYAYFDPPGILTVCMGHTGKDVRAGRYYSDGECYELAKQDAGAAVDAVLRCAPDAPDSVATAFGDAVFNIGPKIACDTANSKAARYLAAKEWRLACEQLPKWDKSRIAGQLVALPGLTKRRKIERDICVRDLP
jgi:lysozyme